MANKITVKSKDELVALITSTIASQGENCDLNFIDVSLLRDLRQVFKNTSFNGDISGWNVSNAMLMDEMFMGSKFNGDISKWNTSSVTDMTRMFKDSMFNGNLSNWIVGRVVDMEEMFCNAVFNGDISNWNVKSVRNMKNMFHGSKFRGDLSKWNASTVVPSATEINVKSLWYGYVNKLNVKVGSKIMSGQDLCVLKEFVDFEGVKLHIVKSPCTGIVKSVLVEMNEEVSGSGFDDDGQAIVVVEPQIGSACQVLSTEIGQVDDVYVKKGDVVAEGQKVANIFSSDIYSPCNGIVSNIYKKKGDSVDDGDHLMDIQIAG